MTLQEAQARAENDLERLGAPRDAWKVLKVELDPNTRALTFRPRSEAKARKLLGEEFQRRSDAGNDPESEADREAHQASILMAVDRYVEAGMHEDAAFAEVYRAHPELFGLPTYALTEPWSAAHVAASASFALQTPAAAFQAGRIAAEHDAKFHRPDGHAFVEALAAFRATHRSGHKRGGRNREGKRKPHVWLIELAVRHLRANGKAPTPVAVKIALTRHVRELFADDFDAKRADALRRAGIESPEYTTVTETSEGDARTIEFTFFEQQPIEMSWRTFCEQVRLARKKLQT